MRKSISARAWTVRLGLPWVAVAALLGCSGGSDSAAALEAGQPSPGGTPAPAAPASVPPPPPPTSVGPDAPVAALTATRLSGPAPLAVQFDASGTTIATTGVTAFHHVSYEFNFGDDRGQTWSVSGAPKNIERGGPLAAHVFDVPGAYSVSVRAQAPNGSYSYATVNVTVQDPASFYSGTRTLCVSPAADYTDCPSGAARQTTLPSNYDDKRVLLHRGERFGAVTVATTDDNAVVGAYGSGAKPVVDTVVLAGGGTVSDWPDNVTVMDLTITNGFAQQVTGSRILLYRCDLSTPVTSMSAQVSVGGAIVWYAENRPGPSYYWPEEVFLVENNILGDTDNDKIPNVTVMGWFIKSAMLGNTVNRATEHTVRMWGAHKAVVAHNALGGDHYTGGGVGIRQALKIHSRGLSPYAGSLQASGLLIASSQVVINNNTLGTSNFPGSWLSQLGPQNAEPTTIEGLEDFVVESNRFARGPYTNSDTTWRGRRMSARNNTVVGGGTVSVSRDGRTFASELDAWDGPYYRQ